MNKRVYGVIGVKSIMSNWNADFTGRPKSISDGQIFGSDKALKYSMKKYWEDKGEKIMYIKSYMMDEKKGKLRPLQLEERYESLFGPLPKKEASEEILTNLFKALDVSCFGATFATKNSNISITGAIQVGQGFNLYEDSEVEIQDILSPFSTGDDKDASTLGKKIVSDEAHYFYPIVVNSNAYNNYKELVPGIEGLTEEVYNKFKEASLCSATILATNSKIGCENEFALFIECEKDVYLPNIANLLTFSKEKEKDKITFKEEQKQLLQQQGVLKIEIYYNPYTTALEGFETPHTTVMNIFTKEVIR